MTGKIRTRNQTVLATPSGWTFALAVVFVAVSVLATSECRQETVEAWRAFLRGNCGRSVSACSRVALSMRGRKCT
jgi:hypothetical protein